MAKDEVFIQNGDYYNSNFNKGAKLFSNYTMANELKLTGYVLDDVFSYGENYYWRIGDGFGYNPFDDNHLIIVDKQIRSNPCDIVNSFTEGVVYSGYSKSIYRTRWDYYCSRNDLSFYDVNDVLLDE